MKLNFVRKDDWIYQLNLLLFAPLYLYRPAWSTWGIVILIALLIGSRLFLKQSFTENNQLDIGLYRIVSLYALMMFMLLGFLLVLHWTKYLLLEKLYLITFCLIQISSVRFQKSTRNE